MNDGRGEAGLDELNKKLLKRTNASGAFYLTHMLLQGRYVLRLVIGQRTTQERHVRAAWELIKTEAEELLRS